MTKIIKREIRYMWLPAILLLLVWLSCARVKKSMTSYETHTDSLRAEKYNSVSVQKKDSTANYKTAAMQAQRVFASDNFVVKFNADTFTYTDPVQVWTDNAGRLNINAGGRSITSIQQKKANGSNNINTTKQAETHVASAFDSNAAAIDKSVEVKEDKKAQDKQVERGTNFFVKVLIVAGLILVAIIALLIKRYWSKIKSFFTPIP